MLKDLIPGKEGIPTDWVIRESEPAVFPDCRFVDRWAFSDGFQNGSVGNLWSGVEIDWGSFFHGYGELTGHIGKRLGHHDPAARAAYSEWKGFSGFSVHDNNGARGFNLRRGTPKQEYQDYE